MMKTLLWIKEIAPVPLYIFMAVPLKWLAARKISVPVALKGYRWEAMEIEAYFFF
jgi:hypothetical protein